MDAKADAAQATADSAYKPGQLPYAVGTYNGSNSSRTVELGFQPSAVVISGVTPKAGMTPEEICLYQAFSSGGTLTDRIQFNDTGFTVIGGFATYPNVSESGRKYDYIAFR